MREGSKSSLYRDEVTRAAMKAMLDAVARYASGLFVPAPLDCSKPDVRGRFRPSFKDERRIDWTSDTAGTILRKIYSADGSPGVLDEIRGVPVYLYGAHREGTLIGPPGEIIAQREGRHLSRRCRWRRLDIAPQEKGAAGSKTFREIWYEESDAVGYVHFNFYNGAMGTDQSRRLTEAVHYARGRPTRVHSHSTGARNSTRCGETSGVAIRATTSRGSRSSASVRSTRP
jgi:putative two-component system protein, hydrogenase maturation factor HypX/HoxX